MTEGNNGSDLIRLEDLYRIYRMGDQEVAALNGLSISFRRGDFWAVMGQSGSGKSTLMNLLGCLDRPTKGRYVLEGKDVGGLQDDALSGIRLRRIGFIFQSFNLIPQLTVQQNIELPLFYLGWKKERSARRSRELAVRVGLEDRLRHRPQELSGGQMQRVAIARALANDPELLLADEPTGNLDSGTGEQILDLLCELHEQGKTIIMVTHEIPVAARARSRMIMKDGRIERIEYSHGDGGPVSA